MAGSFYPLGLAMIGGLVKSERMGAATSLFSLGIRHWKSDRADRFGVLRWTTLGIAGSFTYRRFLFWHSSSSLFFCIAEVRPNSLPSLNNVTVQDSPQYTTTLSSPQPQQALVTTVVFVLAVSRQAQCFIVVSIPSNRALLTATGKAN